MERRTDKEQAAIVLKGILLDAAYGVIRAWAFMMAHRVSQEVIERVLGDPQWSRDADRQARQQAIRLAPGRGD